MAEGLRYASKQDWRKAGKANREAIALRPDEPTAYFNLGAALTNSGHIVEAAQRYLEARERFPVGSELWAEATAYAFDVLSEKDCDEVAKPEWWNDEALKALSARVVMVAPNDEGANKMRAYVLSGLDDDARVKLRSAADFKQAATHWERAAELSHAPAVKVERAASADWCRNKARELIRANVLLELDAQVEEAKHKVEEARLEQAQLS